MGNVTSHGQKKAAVIGNPINHSKSPLIHGPFIKQHGLNATYGVRCIPTESDLEVFMDELRTPEWAGVNVTIPYKEAVLPYLDWMDDNVRMIGACNTIVNKDGQLMGYNTDAAGFAYPLHDQSLDTVMVIGNGGAAKAVLYACLQRGVSSIVLVARRHSASDAIVARLQSAFKGTIQKRSFDSVDETPRMDMVVNTTSVGMAPDDPLFPHIATMTSGQIFYDLIYSPWETPMMRMAQSKGATVINGAWMLAGQGAVAFERLFGKPADPVVMHRALVDSIQQP